MEPLFFGSGDLRLYGVYHPPQLTATIRGAGILLCTPAGQEYMRMHRAYRWLAELLTRRGYHVFRFDYPGLGNSKGEMLDQTMDRWIESAELALRKLSHLSGVQSHIIIGSRLGTVVAANVAANNKLNKLVLWEPRQNAYAFVQEMKQIVEQKIQPRANFTAVDGTLHFNGYPYSVPFMESLQTIEFANLDLSSIEQLLVITSEPDETLHNLTTGFNRINQATDFQYIEGMRDWNTVDQLGGIFLPQQILRAIDQWID